MKEDIYYVYINGEGKVKKFDNINKIKFNLSDKKF